MAGKKAFFILARNINREIVCADDVVRDGDYYCLECSSELVLHRGEKGLRRPHFVHKNTSNCKPETVLHAGFKMLIAERIERDIEKGEEINVQWSCDSCGEDHVADLSQKISQVFVEKSLTSEFRPDIILNNKEGNPFAVIEVVVTHAPEKQYIKFLKKEGIILIRFDLKSESNIKKAKQKILKPTSMKHCLNPKCEKCGEHKMKSKMTIITIDCWKCNSPLNVAAVDDGSTWSPRNFTEKELKMARENSVIIQNRYSKTAEETRPTCVCLHCNYITGNGHISRYLLNAVAYNDYYHEVIDCGYSCNCDREEKDERSEEEIKRAKETQEKLKDIISQFGLDSK